MGEGEGEVLYEGREMNTTILRCMRGGAVSRNTTTSGHFLFGDVCQDKSESGWVGGWVGEGGREEGGP